MGLLLLFRRHYKTTTLLGGDAGGRGSSLAGQWTFVACDGSGSTLCELTRHQGTSVSYKRNWYPECQFTLSHDDDECALILNALRDGTGGGMPTLKAYRTDVFGTKVLRFNGYLATISEESGPDASSATFTYRGPFARLLGDGSTRGRFITSQIVYGPTDAGDLARSLLNDAAVYGGGQHGMTFDGWGINPTKTRQRTYPAATSFGEAIVNLTNVLEGFDFDVAPYDPATWTGPLFTTYPLTAVNGTLMGVFRVFVTQGVERVAAKFEYGPGTFANCSAMHRQTLPPINIVTVVGNALYSTKTNDISIAKYGAWPMTSVTSDVSEQATLDDKANALLRPNPVKTLDFTPELSAPSCPHPFDDFYLGDTVPFYARRGALVENASLRVNAFTVTIDPDTGLESTAIPDPTTPDEEATIRASLQTEVVA